MATPIKNVLVYMALLFFINTTHPIVSSSCNIHYDNHEVIIRTIADLLDSVQVTQEYYASIQDRPLAYFISKNPGHWIFGKKRSYIITEALKNLKELQTKLATDLGKVLKHKASDGTIEIPEELYDIELYKNEINQKLHALKQPSHISRNWLPYTALFTAGALSYWYIKKNPAAIENITKQTSQNLDYFWNEHIKKPYYDIKDTFLPNGPSTNDIIKTEKDAQRNMVRSYLNDEYGKATFLQHRVMSPKERDAIAFQAAEYGILPVIMEDWAKESTNSNLNIFFGNTLRLGKIQLQQLKILALELKARINGVIAIATVLPASVLLGTTGYLGSKIVAIVHPKKIVPKQIRTYLINLQKIYRHNLYTNQLSYYETGMHLYWLTKLKTMVSKIPVEDRSLFTDNLNELESQTYSHEQKTILIGQMFQNFSFL
jgi:hypothetical protein